MRLEIPDDTIEAIKTVVMWSRSCDGPDDILEDAIPRLNKWLVASGLLPPEGSADRALLDLIREVNAVRYYHEVDTTGSANLDVHLTDLLPALSAFLEQLREERSGGNHR
jgi:hypothetical protein